MGFRGQWATISTYIVGTQTTMYLGGGGRGPKFLSRYLPKIRVCSAVYPNFSFRQLPSASLGFRGLPWTSVGNGKPSPHILLGCRQQCIGGGSGSQSFCANIYLKLEFAVLFIPILASVRFRQLPSASVGFLGLQSPNLMDSSEKTGALRDSSGAPYNYSTTRRVARGGGP